MVNKTTFFVCISVLCTFPVFAQVATQRNDLLNTKPPIGKTRFLREVKYAEIKTWQFNLVNGVSLVLRADDSQKDIVLKAICPGGASLLDGGSFSSALVSGDIVSKGGLWELEGKQVGKILKEKGIIITPRITPGSSMINGKFKAEDLEAALQVITLLFKGVKNDEPAFDAGIQSLEAEALRNSKDPYTVFKDSVDATLYGKASPRLRLETFNDITVDKVYNAFNKCFGNSRGYTFIFTGNLMGNEMNEPAQLLPLLTQYLQALPSSETSKTFVGSLSSIPRGKIIKNIVNPKIIRSAVNLTYSGGYEYSDSVNLQLKVLRFLLERKLNQSMVFKGTDSANVSVSLNKFPEAQYTMNVEYKCDPSEVKKSLAFVQTSIRQLQTNVTLADIRQYVDKYKAKLKEQTLDYKWWAEYLSVQFFNGDDPEEIAHYPYNFYKATPETIQHAASQYLSGINYIQLVLLPKKNKSE